MLAENVFVVRNFGQSRGFADCLYLLTVAADSTYAFRKAKRPGLQRRGKPQPQRAAEESRRQARWQSAYRATLFETRLIIRGCKPQVQEDQPPASVAEWLKQTNLEMCGDALKELGCDDMDMLVEGDEEDIADIVAAVEATEGIKKLAVKKFKRELAKLRGEDEQPAAALP